MPDTSAARRRFGAGAASPTTAGACRAMSRRSATAFVVQHHAGEGWSRMPAPIHLLRPPVRAATERTAFARPLRGVMEVRRGWGGARRPR